MKGKITIVLFSLVLVFGMLAASCDDGAFPSQDTKDAITLWAYYALETEGVPSGTTNKALLATIDGLFDDDGKPDESKIKVDDPRLSKTFVVRGDVLKGLLEVKQTITKGAEKQFVYTYMLSTVAIKNSADSAEVTAKKQYVGLKIVTTKPVETGWTVVP